MTEIAAENTGGIEPFDGTGPFDLDAVTAAVETADLPSQPPNR